MNAKEFIAKHNLHITVTRVGHNPGMDDMPRHFHVVISQDFNPEKFSTPFSQGRAHTKPPTLPDVLECLSMDFSCVGMYEDVTEFLVEMGYDWNDKKMRRNGIRAWQQIHNSHADFLETFGREVMEDLQEVEW
jgi:hypothetical protein